MAADGGADSAMIRASHLLVAYQGAMRSSQTRTKEEAKTRAEAALKRAKKGEDFATLVKAFGWYAEGPITEPSQIRAAVQRAAKKVMKDGQPALVDVICAHR